MVDAPQNTGRPAKRPRGRPRKDPSDSSPATAQALEIQFADGRHAVNGSAVASAAAKPKSTKKPAKPKTAPPDQGSLF